MEAKEWQFLQGFLLPLPSTEHQMWAAGQIIQLLDANKERQAQFLQTSTYVNINIQFDIFSTQYKYMSQLLSCVSSQSVYLK